MEAGTLQASVGLTLGLREPRPALLEAYRGSCTGQCLDRQSGPGGACAGATRCSWAWSQALERTVSSVPGRGQESLDAAGTLEPLRAAGLLLQLIPTSLKCVLSSLLPLHPPLMPPVVYIMSFCSDIYSLLSLICSTTLSQMC